MGGVGAKTVKKKDIAGATHAGPRLLHVRGRWFTINGREDVRGWRHGHVENGGGREGGARKAVRTRAGRTHEMACCALTSSVALPQR